MEHGQEAHPLILAYLSRHHRRLVISQASSCLSGLARGTRISLFRGAGIGSCGLRIVASKGRIMVKECACVQMTAWGSLAREVPSRNLRSLSLVSVEKV